MSVIGDSEKIDRPELVFGLVGPAGIRIDDLSSELTSSLEQFGYQTEEIRLSGLLENFDATKAAENDEAGRITHLQKKGDEFRRKLQDGGALARAAVVEIRKTRANRTGNPDQPASNCAYILRQLKHPDEVALLRQVYGNSFALVAGHAPREKRAEFLAHVMASSAGQPHQWLHFMGKANDIINNDEKQDDDFGQNTRDTYPLADFFTNLAIDLGEFAVRRFVELIFGHPFLTPSPDEYSMYQASAASFRSSDDNRQVGAAIAKVDFGNRKKNADVIAVGMNEVPRAGGGAYWQDDSIDARDQALSKRGEDRAKEIKTSALAELIERMGEKGLLDKTISNSASQIARSLLPTIKGTQFMDMGEFSRPVHAEMAALLDAARRGVAVDRKTMYVTTFPCHNCAKHIIASGITQVIYLEPYPKSRARDLYQEEVNLEAIDREKPDEKVAFFAFSGIAPRQYQQLFSMSERGAKKGKSIKEWEARRISLLPLYVSGNAAFAYVRAECDALEKLPTEHYKWDVASVCPAAYRHLDTFPANPIQMF